MKLKPSYLASELADNWWWDEKYCAVAEHGRRKWEVVRYTSGGKLIRLARLQNDQYRVFARYVSPDTKMRLVLK
jgi:hypothetical protein